MVKAPRIAVILILLLVAGGRAKADDAALLGTGGSLQLMDEHSSIRMVRETVTAKLRKTKRPMVRCEFIFKNEGEATKVKIGFPSVAWGDAAKQLNKDDLKNFRSWVDGKPISTTFVRDKNSSGQNYKAWYVKTVSFNKGQVRTIVDSFEPDLGGDSIGGRFFVYVLKTGSSWKGPIGEANIELDISQQIPYTKLTNVIPKKYVQKGDRLIWTMRNFEPQEDIQVYFAPNPPKVIINGNIVGSEFEGIHVDDGVIMLSEDDFAKVDSVVIKNKGKKDQRFISANGHTVRIKDYSTNAVLDNGKIIQTGIKKWPGFVPLEAVTKALGGTLHYDKPSNTLKVKI